MKQTSKKKALKYIREKNAYNRGAESRGYMKFSAPLCGDLDFVNSEIKHISNRQIKDLQRQYKIKFELISAEVGTSHSDHARGLATVLFTYKKS